MIYILIIGLVVLIIAFLANASDKHDMAFTLAILGSWFMSGAIMNMEMNKKPSAMDVYQGKTTIEITYKNNVPVDSVVVFKDK